MILLPFNVLVTPAREQFYTSWAIPRRMYPHRSLHTRLLSLLQLRKKPSFRQCSILETMVLKFTLLID